MQATPRGFRIQIGIFGRRNTGKSTLLNALAGQDVSIVSDTPGTTTDPVEKAMELQPIGPVLFIDTAGMDDEGALGSMRNARSERIIERTDIAILVTEAGRPDPFDAQLLALLRARGIPVLVAENKADLAPGPATAGTPGEPPRIPVCARTGAGLAELRAALVRAVPPERLGTPAIAGDLVPPGGLAVLVVPIDLEAPAGRLILPQVQTIRDLLDHDACCAMVKERELRCFLDNLKTPPALVITDSQAFLKVAADTPLAIPLTSFSILFARLKGDLVAFTEGVLRIGDLRPGDRVLIAEACTHHPVGEDIGRVKIPRWLTQYVGARLDFQVVSGADFPADLTGYRMVIHCGSCTFNRQALLSRIAACRAAGVPITNYGMVLAHTQGLLERALSPFPAARNILRSPPAIGPQDKATKEQP